MTRVIYDEKFTPHNYRNINTARVICGHLPMTCTSTTTSLPVTIAAGARVDLGACTFEHVGTSWNFKRIGADRSDSALLMVFRDYPYDGKILLFRTGNNVEVHGSAITFSSDYSTMYVAATVSLVNPTNASVTISSVSDIQFMGELSQDMDTMMGIWMPHFTNTGSSVEYEEEFTSQNYMQTYFSNWTGGDSYGSRVVGNPVELEMTSNTSIPASTCKKVTMSVKFPADGTNYNSEYAVADTYRATQWLTHCFWRDSMICVPITNQVSSITWATDYSYGTGTIQYWVWNLSTSAHDFGTSGSETYIQIESRQSVKSWLRRSLQITTEDPQNCYDENYKAGRYYNYLMTQKMHFGASTSTIDSLATTTVAAGKYYSDGITATYAYTNGIYAGVDNTMSYWPFAIQQITLGAGILVVPHNNIKALYVANWASDRKSCTITSAIAFYNTSAGSKTIGSSGSGANLTTIGYAPYFSKISARASELGVIDEF